jgi:uncharacterized SAM-binding protein YcdF (DUF218 family)
MSITLFVKQFITFFVEPLGLVLTLLSLGLYFMVTQKQQRAKIFLGLGLFFLVLFSYPPFANFLAQNLEKQYKKYDYITQVKYIHVLGNGHNTDITQPVSSHLSDSGTKRVLEGVIIYKNTSNAKLIFTGYAGKTNTPNATMNAQLASALGVKKESMIINPKPVDTREEALFTKTIVGTKPFVLVTSATHMPRAMMLFQSFGMNPIAAPTDFQSGEANLFFKAPSPTYFKISQIAMHEYLGLIWAKIRG